MPHTLLSTAPRPAELRITLWLGLVAFAVCGSCLYGASLSLVLPAWAASATAIWFAGSAGLAWGVFIPALCFLFRIPLVRAIQVSLVTMAGGEVVLSSGTLVNFVLAALQSVGLVSLHDGTLAPVFTIGTVAISNVAMFLLLATQLRDDCIPVRRILVAWMLVLNGSGALFFTLSYQVLLRQ